MANYKFIQTLDENTRDKLLSQGLVMVSDHDGVFTFMNDKSLKFEDTSQIHYSNILHF